VYGAIRFPTRRSPTMRCPVLKYHSAPFGIS